MKRDTRLVGTLPTETRFPTTSLMDLDIDIILLILEQINLADSEYGIKEQSPSSSATFECQSDLYYQTHKTLPILRLVSRDLQRLVTPIRYRAFKVKLSNLSNDISGPVVKDVKRFTRHAIFSQDVMWEFVTAFYDSLPRLETIRWSFNSYSENWIKKNLTPIPLSILRPNVQLSIHATGFFHDFIPLIPPSSVVSLNLGYFSTHAPSVAYFAAAFKGFLITATNLRSLTCEFMDEGAGSEVLRLPRLLPHERLPAFEELILTGYIWRHSHEEVKQSWNFRNLRSLDIQGINLSTFLSSVRFEDFTNLRILHTGYISWRARKETSLEKIEREPALLADFLRSLRNLEGLYITGRTYALVPFDIFEYMGKLTKLVYREKSFWRTSGLPIDPVAKNSPGSFGVDRLRLLKRWCPKLEELESDMDLPRCDFPIYIEILASFPWLKKATLYTRLAEPDWHVEMESRFVNASYGLFETASNYEISNLNIDLTVHVGKFQKKISNSRRSEDYLEWVTGRTFSKHWIRNGESETISDK